jgi:hypothetical protein
MSRAGNEFNGGNNQTPMSTCYCDLVGAYCSAGIMKNMGVSLRTHFFAESNGSCGVLSCSYTEYDVGAKQPNGGFIQGHGHGIQINTCIVENKNFLRVIRKNINIRYGILMRTGLRSPT